MTTIARMTVTILVAVTLVACQRPTDVPALATATGATSGPPAAITPLATGRTTTLGELSATATALARSAPAPMPTRAP